MDIADFAREAAPLHARTTRVVWLVCGDRALAEDCAQEALLRAWGKVRGGEHLRSLEAWTTRVAINECRSRGRRRSAEGRALERLGPADGSAPPADRTETVSGEVVEALRSLPLRQREVVVLHYLLDYEIARIAEICGISAGAVKNALFHGRAALASTLPAPAATTPGEDRP